MTSKEVNSLIKEFKQLVLADINGITVTDARNTVTKWLDNIGEYKASQHFEEGVYKYQSSKKVLKLEEQRDLEQLIGEV